MAECQVSAVAGDLSQEERGPCLDPLRLMTYNANALFTVTSGPEYKYCKILKAANKLRLDAPLIQETRVNGLVDWQVTDLELGAGRYGYIGHAWLETRQLPLKIGRRRQCPLSL